MNSLGIIIRNEYQTAVRTRSFWIGTFIVPVLILLFTFVIGYIVTDFENSADAGAQIFPEESPVDILQTMGMFGGIFLAIFLMIYGAQIYNMVKKEKCNRVMEIMATCVAGRTMMLGKVISVGLMGLTQLLCWVVIFVMAGSFLSVVSNFSLPPEIYSCNEVYIGMIWLILFFIGGYIFYGSIFAACGAMTDKDNENQAYMTVLTFLLLGSFYIGEYAVTNSSDSIVMFCSFFPFTAPTISAVNAVTGNVPVWQSVLALAVLYMFAFIAVVVSGKIYTSTLLLKGKRLSPKDIVTFLRSK